MHAVYTVSEGKHEVNVMGRKWFYTMKQRLAHTTSSAAAAEQAINITKSLIDLAKIENDLSKQITMYAHVFPKAVALSSVYYFQLL